jgi:hypothetical protein
MKSKLTTAYNLSPCITWTSYYHSHHSQLLHRHSELELFYVINGTGRYMVNGRTWAIQKGNLVICASGILHGEEPFSDNDMETYCCVLKDLQFHPMTEKDFFTLIQHPVLYFPPGDERLGFEHLLLSLASFGKHLPDSASLCGRISEILLDIVLQKLARRHRQDTPSPPECGRFHRHGHPISGEQLQNIHYPERSWRKVSYQPVLLVPYFQRTDRLFSY